MRTIATAALALVMSSGPLLAQETKPVPKDSVRVSISGCTRGYIFTAGASIANLPASLDIPEGTHLRMNGPKKLISAIDAYLESMIQITGLMKKDQFKPNGVGLGGGVRIMPGASPTAGGPSGVLAASQIMIDVEGWNPAPGKCPSR